MGRYELVIPVVLLVSVEGDDLADATQKGLADLNRLNLDIPGSTTQVVVDQHIGELTPLED